MEGVNLDGAAERKANTISCVFFLFVVIVDLCRPEPGIPTPLPGSQVTRSSISPAGTTIATTLVSSLVHLTPELVSREVFPGCTNSSSRMTYDILSGPLGSSWQFGQGDLPLSIMAICIELYQLSSLCLSSAPWPHDCFVVSMLRL